jgi:hypothetical protein
MRVMIALLAACEMWGQAGQQGPKPEWPCVAGRAVDPAYLETSESTGGQIFLFQKSEIGQAGLFLTADSTHPATVVRAVGTLSGARDFEFAVDSTMQSLLVMASLQCRKTIGVFRPSGTEMTAANSTQNVDLQAGRGLRIDQPESGKWKLRLEGTGLFVVTVRAQSPVRLTRVELSAGAATAHVAGEVADPKFQLIGPSGDLVADAQTGETTASGFRIVTTPGVERFRVRMTGVDGSGWPVERVYPVLFRAPPAQ